MFGQKLSIRRRILYIFLSLAILLSVVNIVKFVVQRAAFDELVQVALEQPLVVSILSQIDESIGKMREETLSVAFLMTNGLTFTDEEVQEEVAEHNAAVDNFGRLIEQFRRIATDPQDIQLADQLEVLGEQTRRNTYSLIEGAAFAALRVDPESSLMELAEVLEADEAAIENLITMEIDQRLRAVEDSQTEIVAFETRNNLVNLAQSVALVVVSFALWLWIDRAVLRPLRQLTDAAVQLGYGDFTRRIEVRQGGEIATLAREFNQMAQNIQLMLEEEADLTKAAKEASVFKTNLIARVSHELRSPLGAINGMAEMLQYGVYGPLNPGQTEVSTRILENTTQLSKLVNEMLAQSRLEARSAEQLDLETTDVQLLVQRIARMHEPIAIQKGLGFVILLEHGLPRRVVTDVSRLEQIVNNLVGNAVKFTEKGRVVVRVTPFGKSEWQLIVRDTGIGIKPEDQPFVFEAFRQGDQSITRKYGGVGLGLSLVKAFVLQLGGAVSFESVNGEGTTFTVTLPNASRATPMIETAEAPQVDTQPARA
jgi:signal transduction histidine kinase